MDHDQRIVHSSHEAGWRTPYALWEALDRVFQLQIDAAASDGILGPWMGPGTFVEGAENALTADWRAVARTLGVAPTFYLNPPYSRTEYRKTRDRSYLIANWAQKSWIESSRGVTVVGLFPFSPQTQWYRMYVNGISVSGTWNGHAAMEVWRLPRRVTFIRPDGSNPGHNAGHNVVVVVWKPNPGFLGPWQPAERYWDWEGWNEAHAPTLFAGTDHPTAGGGDADDEAGDDSAGLPAAEGGGDVGSDDAAGAGVWVRGEGR